MSEDKKENKDELKARYLKRFWAFPGLRFAPGELETYMKNMLDKSEKSQKLASVPDISEAMNSDPRANSSFHDSNKPMSRKSSVWNPYGVFSGVREEKEIQYNYKNNHFVIM